jgi:hypothetical protein
VSAQLFAIASLATGDILWAGLAEPEDAEWRAACVAVGSGNVSLLSGEDLALHLLGGEEPRHGRRLHPVHAMEETWKPGDSVEYCSNLGSGSNPKMRYRPARVERIDREWGYHESLVVRFEDGDEEVRAINPDVMRHRQ